MTDPSEKYRAAVDPAHKLAIDSIAFAFQLLEPQTAHIVKFLEAEQRSHALGPILDPTFYRDQINSKNFALQVRMAQAARAFISELSAVMNEVPK